VLLFRVRFLAVRLALPQVACCTSGISSGEALKHSQLLQQPSSRPESSPPCSFLVSSTANSLHIRSSLVSLRCASTFVSRPLQSSPHSFSLGSLAAPTTPNRVQ
jgi:hypothetical protein